MGKVSHHSETPKTRYRSRKECRFTHSILHDHTWKISFCFFHSTLLSPHLVNCAALWPVFLLHERGLMCQLKRICWVITVIDKRWGSKISRLLIPSANGGVGALGKCYTPGKNGLHQSETVEIGEECHFQS